MLKTSRLWFFLIWLCCSGLTWAEYLPDVPPPTAPLVAELPSKARWSLSGVGREGPPPESRASNEPGKPSAIKIESILWNSVKSDTIYRSDAAPATLVYYSGFVLVDGKSSSGKKTPVLVQQIQGTDYSALRSTGWLGTEWINENHYLGAEMFKRQATKGLQNAAQEVCYVFLKPPVSHSDEGYHPEVKAWIRVSDKVPVAVSIDGNIFEFEVHEPPIQPPAMSGEQASKLLELKDRNDRMTRLQQRSKQAVPN